MVEIFHQKVKNFLKKLFCLHDNLEMECYENIGNVLIVHKIIH